MSGSFVWKFLHASHFFVHNISNVKFLLCCRHNQNDGTQTGPREPSGAHSWGESWHFSSPLRCQPERRAIALLKLRVRARAQECVRRASEINGAAATAAAGQFFRRWARQKAIFLHQSDARAASLKLISAVLCRAVSSRSKDCVRSLNFFIKSSTLVNANAHIVYDARIYIQKLTRERATFLISAREIKGAAARWEWNSTLREENFGFVVVCCSRCFGFSAAAAVWWQQRYISVFVGGFQLHLKEGAGCFLVVRVSRIELKRAESIALSTKRRFLEPAHTHTQQPKSPFILLLKCCVSLCQPPLFISKKKLKACSPGPSACPLKFQTVASKVIYKSNVVFLASRLQTFFDEFLNRYMPEKINRVFSMNLSFPFGFCHVAA